jgi:osmoprotectant transport system permease protein
VAVTNIGRAIPSLGWLGMVLPITLVLFERGGLGFLPALVALVALAIPPIVTNTYAGLREVDRELIDAARGMGMGERRILAGVEVPIALPVILAGIRSSAVQVVATATLAAVVAGGTLGEFILQGIFVRDLPRVFGAALMVAALALATEGLFALLQRLATPPGLQGSAAVTRPS